MTLEERGDDLGSLRQWQVDGRDDDYQRWLGLFEQIPVILR